MSQSVIPEKMSLTTLASVCSKLVAEKQMHRDNALFFSKLFNRAVPAEMEKKLAYTSLQRFYQLRAEYHVSQLMRIEVEIEKLDGFANSDLFPALG